MRIIPTFRQLLRIVYLGCRAGLSFLRDAIGLLAASANPAPADDPLNNAIRGGVLNHRTGKFDDGTDPAGIYRLD